MPLATLDDLEARSGAPIVGDPARAQAEAFREDASAAVRSYTGQYLSARSTTTTLDVRGGLVILPQRPVTAVTEVLDLNTNEVAYEWDGRDRVTVNPAVPDTWAWEPRRTRLERVVVTYDHGHDPVPDDVVAVVARMTLRELARSGETAGVASEQVGPFARTYSTSVLLADERATLDRYRRLWARPAYGGGR